MQRVPVRIQIDDGDLVKSPLRVGLSATVTVDTTDRDGPVLARQVRGQAGGRHSGLYPGSRQGQRRSGCRRAPQSRRRSTKRGSSMAERRRRPAALEYPPLRGGKLLFLTAAIATASFMEILDMTIVNVSVPAISGSLGVSTSEGTWAISSYMLAAAIMQPLTGWIGGASAKSGPSSLPFCCSCAFRLSAGWPPACPCWSARASSRGWCPDP